MLPCSKLQTLKLEYYSKFNHDGACGFWKVLAAESSRISLSYSTANFICSACVGSFETFLINTTRLSSLTLDICTSKLAAPVVSALRKNGTLVEFPLSFSIAQRDYKSFAAVHARDIEAILLRNRNLSSMLTETNPTCLLPYLLAVAKQIPRTAHSNVLLGLLNLAEDDGATCQKH
jgi:hypothetical protein